MASPPPEEPLQTSQRDGDENNDMDVDESAPPSEPLADTHRDSEVAETDTGKPKKKREINPAPPIEREPGKSLLPFSRVQKILKADKELPMVAREATFLISIATEEFIKRIAEESRIVASRENRVTVQYKDIANVVRRIDKFMFLDEIIPLQDPEAQPRKKPVPHKTKDDGKPRPATMLDAFVKKNNTADEDVVMNEDGTMTMVETSE